MTDYAPAMLDMVCLTGEVGWARLSSGPSQVVGATPIALFLRQHADQWLALRTMRPADYVGTDPSAASVLEYLRRCGASFFQDLAAACGVEHNALRSALGELVAVGLVSSDGFAGLRGLIGTGPPHAPARLNRVDAAGRWCALPVTTAAASSIPVDEAVETLAWALLRRYGVVFRRLLTREAATVPWRDLARVYRRLEARGEIRGGRFVSGMSGEQFALADAIPRLREIRRRGDDRRLLTISAADPLNLTGIVTAGDRVRAVAGSRIVYRGGVPLAAMEGDLLRILGDIEPAMSADVAAAAAGRRVPAVSGYVGAIR